MSLKREHTEMLEDSQIDSQIDSQESQSQSPPRKKRKLSNLTPILTPTLTPSHEHDHSHSDHHHHHHHDRDNDKNLKIPIIRCFSGHGMVRQQLTKKKKNTIICQECDDFIKQNDDYYQCPLNEELYVLCISCWNKEKQQYTGSITLGQRVRIKINNEWKLGSIIKHWADDDLYTIQIDGQKRSDAQAYDIYDAHWNVQLVQKNKLKPMPTRILTQCDTDYTQRTIPRCSTGCKMMTMDADKVYNDDDEDEDKTKGKKLEFNSDDDSDDDDDDDDDNKDDDIKKGGIFCNECGDHIKAGTIYHCPNATHEEGYDLCLKCSKKLVKKPPILNSYDIDGLSKFISSGSCRKIGILCGAGISRSAGIPDFRSPDGIYKTLSADLGKNVLKYGLTLRQKKEIEDDAQYVFSIDLFKENPSVLYRVLGDILNKRCKPTLTHCFFKLLQTKGLLKYIFTQNVDGLERYIGIDPKILTEVHGTFLTASCFKCGEARNIAEVRKKVKNGDIPIKCNNIKCKKGYIKPDCVLFGEDLPNKYYDAIDKFKKNKDGIDLLIVMGTSLSVKPVSCLPDQVNNNAIRCVFNLELNDEINEIFNFHTKKKKNKRDIFIKGKCDESITTLCKLLKWNKDLNKIYKDSNKLAKKIVNELKNEQKDDSEDEQ